jgi:hypothetical protein
LTLDPTFVHSRGVEADLVCWRRYGPAVSEPWRALGIVAAALAAGAALAAFWPRGYQVLDNVRDYLRSELPDTQLVLVDTLAEMNPAHRSSDGFEGI